MSRVSINEASKKFAVSRNTIYARIKAGQLTKDSDGKVDTADLIRIFGSNTGRKVQDSSIEHAQLNNSEQLLKQENEQLKRQIEQLQQQIQDSKEREEHYRQKEQWYMVQLEQQKRIEHKPKGLLSKLFG